METYKNPFDPHEDAMLWELHEIRHELHDVLSHKTVDEINAIVTINRWTSILRALRKLCDKYAPLKQRELWVLH